MTPNVDERLASIVRSLSEVVLPHLPPEASLAQGKRRRNPALRRIGMA